MRAAITAALALAAILAAWIGIPAAVYRGGSEAVPFFQSVVNPAALSAKHAFLDANCEACHTPNQGIEASSCAACHADNKVLLASQATAFHASIQDCKGCHVEHRGRLERPTTMEHEVLAALGGKQSGLPPVAAIASLATLIRNPVALFRDKLDVAGALDCAMCHASKDRHVTLFGRDCQACHAMGMWTIAAFRHPSPQSTDCAQCHQAPPSHYMEHFQMVSMTVAGQMRAQVSQCFLCHQTTAWNDIKGVGWYKHH